MTADFQFGAGGEPKPAEPQEQTPAVDGMPSMPPQPEVPPVPPVPPVSPYAGNPYIPPTPVNPPPAGQQPVNGAGGYPPYSPPPAYTYNPQQQGAQPQQPYAYYQQQPGYGAPYYPPAVSQNAPGNGFAVASLILGIVALLSSCSLILTIPCAVVGLILGIIGKNKGAGGMAVAGIVLSALGLAVAIFLIVFLVASSSFIYETGDLYYGYTMNCFMR